MADWWFDGFGDLILKQDPRSMTSNLYFDPIINLNETSYLTWLAPSQSIFQVLDLWAIKKLMQTGSLRVTWPVGAARNSFKYLPMILGQGSISRSPVCIGRWTLILLVSCPPVSFSEHSTTVPPLEKEMEEKKQLLEGILAYDLMITKLCFTAVLQQLPSLIHNIGSSRVDVF